MTVKAPTVGALTTRLNNMAKSLSLAAPQFGKGIGNAYLAWAMFETAKTLRASGVSVTPKDNAGNLPNPFIVRGAPGYIHAPASAKANEPCHFELVAIDNGDLELHASVRHGGFSCTDHELDLSVMPKADVDNLRAQGGGIYEGRRIAGIELKAYDIEDALNKNIPRAFCGVAFDLDPQILLPHFSVTVHRTFSFRRDYSLRYALWTSTAISTPSKTYLNHYDIVAEEHVLPGNLGAITDLAHHIRYWL